MAKQFLEITDALKKFIEQQEIFFVGTADVDGRVNVSPKGSDSLRVVGKNRVVWLNLTGSSNETAAHMIAKNRITIMKYKPIVWKTSPEDSEALKTSYLAGDGLCPACKRDGLQIQIEERFGETS